MKCPQYKKILKIHKRGLWETHYEHCDCGWTPHYITTGVTTHPYSTTDLWILRCNIEFFLFRTIPHFIKTKLLKYKYCQSAEKERCYIKPNNIFLQYTFPDGYKINVHDTQECMGWCGTPYTNAKKIEWFKKGFLKDELIKIKNYR